MEHDSFDTFLFDDYEISFSDHDEHGICQDCNGSGEGRHDGSTCKTCRGAGET